MEKEDVVSNLCLDTGAFFLLACAKESDLAVKTFVLEKVEKVGPVKQKEAIQRFQVLWQARYGVWPRMEERAQKKFKMYQEKEKDDKKVSTTRQFVNSRLKQALVEMLVEYFTSCGTQFQVAW